VPAASPPPPPFRLPSPPSRLGRSAQVQWPACGRSADRVSGLIDSPAKLPHCRKSTLLPSLIASFNCLCWIPHTAYYYYYYYYLFITPLMQHSKIQAYRTYTRIIRLTLALILTAGYLMENPQDKKDHKTTYTCPHTCIISICYSITHLFNISFNFQSTH